MGSLKRGLVYSLLLSVGLLVAGLVTLLWVADAREQRYKDELGDMGRSLSECTDKLNQRRPTSPAAIADSSGSSRTVDTTLQPGSATSRLPNP